jgi:hypothetical protein
MRNLLGMPAWLLRASARVLLVALSVTALGPIAHDTHEDLCDPSFVVHDETQHHVQANQRSADPSLSDHCVACHFARSSRGLASWQLTGLTAFAPGVLLFHSDGQLPTASFAAPLPARAPPALA